MNPWERIQAGDGLLLLAAGLTVVFLSLLVLLVVTVVIRITVRHLGRAARAAEGAALPAGAPAGGVEEELPATLVAAIALTLALEDEHIHDRESLVLTLQRLPRLHSNWWQSRIDPQSLPVTARPRARLRPSVLTATIPEER